MFDQFIHFNIHDTMRLLVISLLATLVVARGPNRMWDDNCGISHMGDPSNAFPDKDEEPLVVGGWEAEPNSIPWMVSLMSSPPSSSHFCGGSIVTNRHIITAAHCVDGDQPGSIRVRVGAHHRQQSTDYDRTFDVIKIDWHPDYDMQGNLDNDVAVLTLAEDIEFTEGYVGTICAPVDDKSRDNYAGRACHTSGWGTTSSGGLLSQVLLYTNMEVTTFQTCVDTHPAGWVEPGMLCAGRPENEWDRDACQGDSGGPLYLWEGEDDEDDGAYVLIGQVSWGIGCAGRTPGVYADTAYYVDYFNYIINQSY